MEGKATYEIEYVEKLKEEVRVTAAALEFTVKNADSLEKQVEILKEALETIIDKYCFPELNQILTVAERALEEAKEEEI